MSLFAQSDTWWSLVTVWLLMWDCETWLQADEVYSFEFKAVYVTDFISEMWSPASTLQLTDNGSVPLKLKQVVSVRIVVWHRLQPQLKYVFIIFHLSPSGLPFPRAPWRRWRGSSDASLRRYEAATPSTSRCLSWRSRWPSRRTALRTAVRFIRRF